MSISKDDMTDVRVFAPRRSYGPNKAVDIGARGIKIVDIHIPFLSLVGLMIKATFAFLLVWVLLFVFGWVFALMVGFPAIGILGGVMGL